jgi:DNA-binding winged helix-turn-helix (wHTH) protein
MQPDTCLEFAPFRLDLANHELWRGEERLPLRPKPFAVLAYLATHPRRLVPREELANAVWPDTHVGDGLLRGYVRDLRTVLGDDADAPRFIETVARLGYRFVAPVRSVAVFAEPGPAVPPGAPRPTHVAGRDAQLRTLEGRLARALGGERQVVFVTGEPGIGKTTLIDGFVARSVAGRDVWLARGQCVEHFGAGEAYLPLLEALGRRLEAAVALRDAPALRVLLDHELAGLPGQLLVVLHLESAQAVVVDADVAEERAGQRARRVEPLRLGHEVDALEVQLLDRFGGGVVDLAGQVDEGVAPLTEPIGQDLLVHAENRGELGGIGGRVGDDLGIGPHRLLVDRQRQVDAVAVEDGAALGGQADLADALAGAELLVLRGRDRLDLGETENDG